MNVEPREREVTHDWSKRDVEPTETNTARLAREAQRRVHGDIPAAAKGSLAEAMGYAPPDEPVIKTGIKSHLQSALAAVNERLEWLQWRRTGVGSSDIAVLMGWGFADQSIYQVWAQKVGLIPAGDADERDEFEFGRRAEPMLAQWFQDETGLYVANTQERRTHATVPYFLATPDGEAFEGPHKSGEGPDAPYEPLGGVEFKTTTDTPKQWEDGPPVRYVAQCQWQMLVCGWERCWLAVLHGRSFRTYLIERDEEDIAVLRDAAHDFWRQHVETGEPPDIDGSSATSAALRDAFRGEKDRTLFEPDLAGKVAMLREAKATAKQWDATADLLENEIKSQLGDAEFLDCGAGVVAQWSRFDTKRIDSDLLKTRFPDAFEMCRKATPSSRFTLKKEKKS